MDPVEIDTNNYHHNLAKYNRAFEALRGIVKEDYLVFEEFLMNEYPDIYNEIDDLANIHDRFIWSSVYNNMSALQDSENFLYSKWLDYVDEETKRRLER